MIIAPRKMSLLIGGDEIKNQVLEFPTRK